MAALEEESQPVIESDSRGLRGLYLRTEYRTGEVDLIREFYMPCLSQADSYDRAVGYFRSSIYSLTANATIEFARRGGKLRLVCSPTLTQEDVQAIDEGYQSRNMAVLQLLEREVDRLLSSIDFRDHAKILGTLIKVGALDLRVAVRPEGLGIFHEKIGLFHDRFGNIVTFKGSSNETWSGWHPEGNVESFEVFRSWHGANEGQRTKGHASYFERLWAGEVPEIETLSFPETAKAKLLRIAEPSLDRLISRESDLKPLAHQVEAIAVWKAQQSRGILEHATGSGKTLTALLALREHLASGGAGLILVPSKLLLGQWAKELKKFMPDATVLRVGAGNNEWRQPGRLEGLSAPGNYRARVILATMQTASLPEFQNRLAAGQHLMMIADEVHQIGSRGYSNSMNLVTGPRLGLSATPHRFGDPEGTTRILNYFGAVVQPVFTLRDAIACGRLVQYEYHPHPVFLTPSESSDWEALTARISQEAARQRGNSDSDLPLSERLKLLLIQRARIAKKAANKVPLAAKVLRENYELGQRWLVYCEDRDQLERVMSALAEAQFESHEYHSQMESDPESAMVWFTQFGGILVAIRCLDEGVDIPEITHALILASSQNPRQFIQRRGRVLRVSPGKAVAVVHDAIVIPEKAATETDQLSLTRSELRRAMEFAKSAINGSAAADLREIAMRAGIGPDDLDDIGVEEEENDPEG